MANISNSAKWCSEGKYVSPPPPTCSPLAEMEDGFPGLLSDLLSAHGDSPVFIAAPSRGCTRCHTHPTSCVVLGALPFLFPS